MGKAFIFLLGILLCTIKVQACLNLAETQLELGLGLYSGGLLDSAENHFKMAIDLDRSCPKAYICLGNVYFLRGQICKKEKKFGEVGALFASAIKYFNHALNLDTSNAIAMTNIGTAYYELNRFEQAKIYFERALGFDSLNAILLQNMGNTIFWSNRDSDYSSAIEYWQRSLKAGGTDYSRIAVIWKNIGIALYKMGQVDSALTAFQRSLSYDSTSSETFVYYGRALATLSQIDVGIEQFKRAIALDSLNVSAYGAWAEAVYILKDSKPRPFTYKDKIKELRDPLLSALKLDSANEARYHLYLGHLYLADGKYRLAAAEYETAKKQDSSLTVPEIQF